MTHDIGNQHQIISGYTELLATLIENDEVQEILGRIMESINKCTNIISMVKESDKLFTTHLYERDLTGPLVNCVRSFSKKHEDAKVNLSITEIQAFVLADELPENLFNIVLHNAYNHNNTKRELIILVSLEKANNGYLVTISDNGHGIIDSEKDILFDMTRRYGGVCLHFARHIIEKYGGCIKVKDRTLDGHEQGAKFEMWFPLLREENTD